MKKFEKRTFSIEGTHTVKVNSINFGNPIK